MEHDNEYMTVGQARDLLGVSKVRMTELLRKKTLETFERGRDRRIKWLKRTDVLRLKQELDEWRPASQSKKMPVAA